MIPYRISFSGIRDYRPMTIDLSGSEEHILISGANGSGKSTLTFCWGAVMASSKVNIEGLRSKNLPDNQVWRAKIELIYENNGFVDASLFVKFMLVLEQMPGQLLKREFYISEGDTVDEWEQEIRFSSSDKTSKIKEYKRLLLQKYKLDPDAFYLIWYQQDVNQFAVMKPEERFRIFSELTGIEKLQKSLEDIKDQAREAETAMQLARNNQTQYKFDLNIWEKEKNRYESQQKRLRDGLAKYQMALQVLESYYEMKHSNYKTDLEEIKIQLNDKYEEIVQSESEIGLLDEEVLKQKVSLNHAEKQLQMVQDELKEQKIAKTYKQRELTNLNEEIKEITERVQRIPHSEKEVDEEQKLKQRLLDQRKVEKNQTEESLASLETEIRTMTTEIAELYVQVETDKTNVASANKYIEQYISSHNIEKQQQQTEILIRQTKDRIAAISQELLNKREEQNQLQLNRYVSQRQKEALLYFKRLDIGAYPLRDLIELEGNADFRSEDILNTIKYTIFVNAKEFVPPNDLYYVPLPLVIPTESVITLPSHQLKIRDHFDENLVSLAMKALWWVKQFFNGEQPTIQHKVLRDVRGFRGVQEKPDYILSEKAMQNRLKETEYWIKEHEELLFECNQRLASLNEEEKQLRDLFYQLRNAESILQQKGERAYRKESLERKSDERLQLEGKLQALRRIDQDHHTSIQVLGDRLEVLKSYKEIYSELHKEQEKIEQMQNLDLIVRKLTESVKELGSREEELEDSCNTLEIQFTKLKRKKNDTLEDLDSLRKQVQKNEKHQQETLEKFLTIEEQLISTQKQQNDMKNTFGSLLEQLESQAQIENWSETKAISIREEGFIMLEQASQEKVNSLAPENYERMKTEYERSNEEVRKSEQFVNEISENMETMKDRLVTTIQMNVHKIHKNFEYYMDQFHFEGKVEWEMDTNKHGELRYYLFIKARKKGHRGKMEDISAKGRGGKVGSGVSGGEESLSSLLFALAMLKTLEASPGYIILDEYDSALDDSRKEKVFTLFEQELKRKMIIVSPKSHDPKYLQHFSKSFTVFHDASVPISQLIQLRHKRKG